jgi:hypothetical protein
MVNVVLAGLLAGGAGFAGGLLTAMSPFRPVPDPKIRGRIIVKS